MNEAIAQMQALPTVLAPIVRIRKEELSLMQLLSAPAAIRRPRALLRDPARRPGARRRPVPARALSAGRRRHAGALARLAVRRAGLRDPVALHRRHPGRRPARACAPRPTPPRSSARDAIVPLQPLEPGVFICRPCPTARRWPSRTWRCSCSGNLFEYELARRGETLNILGATSGDTGSAAEYAMRGKNGVAVFMLSPHGRMSPFQQAQMFSLQDANIHNIAVEGVFDDCQDIVKAVVERPGVQAQAPHRHGQLDQLGAPAGAGGLLLRRLLPGHDVERRRRVELRRAVGQLRQHLRRPRGAHDGPADRAAGARHQRERRARRVLPHRHLPRARGAETHETSSPSMDISKARNFERFVFDLLRPRRRAHARAVRHAGRRATAASTLDADRRTRAAGRSASCRGRSTHADRLATIRETHGSASAT